MSEVMTDCGTYNPQMANVVLWRFHILANVADVLRQKCDPARARKPPFHGHWQNESEMDESTYSFLSHLDQQRSEHVDQSMLDERRVCMIPQYRARLATCSHTQFLPQSRRVCPQFFLPRCRSYICKICNTGDKVRPNFSYSANLRTSSRQTLKSFPSELGSRGISEHRGSSQLLSLKYRHPGNNHRGQGHLSRSSQSNEKLNEFSSAECDSGIDPTKLGRIPLPHSPIESTPPIPLDSISREERFSGVSGTLKAAAEEAEGLTAKFIKGAENRQFSKSASTKEAFRRQKFRVPASKMFLLPLQRLLWAIPTWPSGPDWIFTLSLAALAAIPIVPLSLWAEMFSLEHMAISPSIIIKTFFVPSLLEEVLWRVLLNPHPKEKAPFETLLFWGILSTILYILAHPTYAWYVRPVAWSLFSHPGFLLICAFLGGCCSVLYQKTGSIWAPTVVHWLTCVIWLSLGGRQRAPLF